MTPKQADFPDLDKYSWAKTSDPDPKYNCIGFAAGRTDVFWWPDDYPDADSDYWPRGIAREETVAAFVQLFQSLGYEICSDGSLEVGYEKVAIYALGEAPTHAARQLSTGQWTSKLGPEEDIVHENTESIAGPCYGSVIQFMKRGSATPPS
ncbi:MAG: hypothetical protein HY289_06975 [Planctomycetes bacterium]|nr:hypothetical protein [Planctomycetota bacterium]